MKEWCQRWIDNKDQLEDVIHRRILTTIDNCLSTRDKKLQLWSRSATRI